MNPAIYYLSGLKRKGVFLYAYSLRRVVSGYTGPGIQVRKGSSTTVFQDFYFNPITGELDQAAILAFVGSGTVGYVRIWYDQSGKGNHLGPTEAVVTREPRIVAPGTPFGTTFTKNGKLAVSFSGSNNFIYLRSPLTSLGLDVNNLSLFIVCASNSVAGTQSAITITGTSNNEIVFPKLVGGSDYYNYNSTDAIVLGTGSLDNKVYSSANNVTTISGYKNNVLVGGPLSIANSAVGNRIILGYNGNFFLGLMQEVLVYNGTPSSRSAMTAEMMSYYSIV